MRPRLKGVAWERAGTDVRVVYDRREQLVLPDPDGVVESLLCLLIEGGRTTAELAAQLSVPLADMDAAVHEFDRYGLVEDGDPSDALSTQDRERYFSNLAFFESFSSLSRSRVDLQSDLRNAHVLALGTGGLNSTIIPHLCGLGVGRLTLLDRDVVELRNFARQYLYQASDIGAPKAARAAEWVRAFDPAIEVAWHDAAISGADHLGELLDKVAPNVVASGIDHPDDVDLWVNAACVSRGIPYVRGGMWVTEGIVWSVDPGRGACLACRPPEPDPGDAAGLALELKGLDLFRSRTRTNRGIGPVAGLLGSLAAFEVLRFLTGFEPPAYAGRPVVIDFASACAIRRHEWLRDADCLVCGADVSRTTLVGPLPDLISGQGR